MGEAAVDAAREHAADQAETSGDGQNTTNQNDNATSGDRPGDAQLLRRAADGDRDAWGGVVERYSRLIWAVTRDFRLSEGDAADVAQTTWLRLLEHVHRVDPHRIGGWLSTTARHECLRIVTLRKRMLLAYDEETFESMSGPQPEVDEALLTHERVRDVRRALQTLPARWQHLLQLSMADPPVPYAEISARLGLPVGSIGPMRGRCLAKLRTLLEV